MQQSRKRLHSDAAEVGNGRVVKNPRLDNSALSLICAPGSAPHLEVNTLSHVTSSGGTPIPSIVGAVSRGQYLLPARPVVLGGNSSSLAPTLSQPSGLGSHQQQQPVVISSVGERRLVPSRSTDSAVPGSLSLGSGMASLFSQPSAATAVALLVQQFKEAQAGGDLSAMDSIRHKLILLHQQLATRAVSSGLSHTSLTNSVGAAAATLAASSKPGLSSNGTVPNRSNFLPLNPFHTTSTQPLVPSATPNFLSSANSSTRGQLQPIPASAAVLSTPLTSLSSSQGKPLVSTGLPSTSSSASSMANLVDGVCRTALHHPAGSVNTLPKFSSVGNRDGSKLPDLPAIPISQISSLMSSIPANNLVSPSIVTQLTAPSLNTSAMRPQGAGLHITAQTQANVLRAVYGYRLRQIQDFLATLPADQRPSSTQELRELLKQNNVLSKVQIASSRCKHAV